MHYVVVLQWRLVLEFYCQHFLLFCLLADSTFQDAVVSDRFHAWIALYHPFEYGMLEVWSGFLRGILWSSIALCVSAYISDPFVVLVSPYFVSFFIVQAYRMGNVVDRYRLDKLLTGNVIIQSSVHTVLICTISCIINSDFIWNSIPKNSFKEVGRWCILLKHFAFQSII